MTYDQLVEDVVRGVEAFGASIMIVGAVAAFAVAARQTLDPVRRPTAYVRLRRTLSRVILLGLEVLIVGDIIRTIVVEPTLTSVAVLGSIVVVRILLSFALEVEIEGVWPWARAREQRAARLAAPEAAPESD